MYRKKASRWLKHLDFIIWDILCLALSFLLAFIMRHGTNCMFILNSHFYRLLFVALLVMDLLSSMMLNTFKNVLKRSLSREISVTLRHIILVETGIVFYLFIMKISDQYSRQILLAFPVLYLIISLLVRELWKYVIRHMPRSWNGRSLLILGCSDTIEGIIHDVNHNNYSSYLVNGLILLDQDRTGEEIEEIPVVAGKEDALDYLCQNWVDEVLIAVNDSQIYPEKLISQITDMGITVHIELGNMKELYGQEQFVQKIGDCMVLTTSINTTTVLEAFLKRSMDIVGGLVGCVLTLFIALIIGPMIYKESKGPIFFAQDRVGRNGKIFRMYKFRSMYMDAEERKAALMAENKMNDNYMFKLDFDPRIIGCEKRADGTIKKGIGNYIRELSLDEFPQFFNVLKGDMSIIGTRPPLISEVEIYKHHHKSRLAMKPGITGLWQISGRSEILDFEEIVKLDRQYINEWSIGMDLKIIFKTIWVVIRKKGAM